MAESSSGPTAYDPGAHLRSYKTEPLSSWYDRVKSQHSRQLWALVSRQSPTTPRILEIGPGHGHFARQARSEGARYSCIEPADSFRERLMHEGFEVTDEIAPPLDRPSDLYDLVVASMVLENMPSTTEAAGLIAEMHRVLAPGGRICLIFPNYLTWGRFFFDEHYTHNYVTTPRRVRHLIESIGFSDVRIQLALGWFWVESNPIRNLSRWTVNVTMKPLHWRWTETLAGSLGLAELHWKLRKTFFESVVVLATASPRLEPVTESG